MKKTFFLLLTTLFVLCGCEINNYDDDGVEIYNSDIRLLKRDWQVSGTEGEPGFYIYQQFEIDAITPRVFEEGAVLVYYKENIDPRTNSVVKHILPYLYPRDVQVQGGYRQIMQNIRYEVEPGLLTVVIEWEDFYEHSIDNMDFRVCILNPYNQKENKRR